jgi:hypothetical protein
MVIGKPMAATAAKVSVMAGGILPNSMIAAIQKIELMLINTICSHLERRIHAGELSNDDLIQIIELCGRYLNLQTISDYARENNISYNGVKKCRSGREIFNVKFVIDND